MISARQCFLQLPTALWSLHSTPNLGNTQLLKLRSTEAMCVT